MLNNTLPLQILKTKLLSIEIRKPDDFKDALFS